MTQEDMPNIREIMDKSFDAGYKDAMDFALDWMKNFRNGNGEFPLYDFVGNLRKAMEEHLCRETSK